MFKAKNRLLTSILTTALICAPLVTWAANPYQSRNTHFGVSGSNVRDITIAFCCGGTLGSLLTDGTQQYILSNNHILAREDRAAVGEKISQPRLIDNGCQRATIVGNFTAAPKLGSNVDAAIAQLITGTMDSTGYIEGIGTISSTIAAPTAGLAVEKSGRTSQMRPRKKFVISTNQVVVNSTTFSAGGDSGSLIVSDNTNHNPVALLFAGSSSTTIANPIDEVLSKVGTALGQSVSPPSRCMVLPPELRPCNSHNKQSITPREC